MSLCISSVLVVPASIIGSELLRTWAPTLRFAPPRCRRGCLMYTKATSLPNLYIRNIIPADTSIPLVEHLAQSGRGYAGCCMRTSEDSLSALVRIHRRFIRAYYDASCERLLATRGGPE